MPKPVRLEAAALLLTAMRPPGADGRSHSFMFGQPGTPMSLRNLGASLHYQRSEMIRAAHYVRQNGAPYLKYLDIADVWSLLTEFVADAYWILAGECWIARFEGSYADRVSPQTLAAFADALAASQLFATDNSNPVSVGADPRGDPVRWIDVLPLRSTEPRRTAGRPASRTVA